MKLKKMIGINMIMNKFKLVIIDAFEVVVGVPCVVVPPNPLRSPYCVIN